MTYSAEKPDGLILMLLNDIVQEEKLRDER